jgi:hypothetical protein
MFNRITTSMFSSTRGSRDTMLNTTAGILVYKKQQGNYAQQDYYKHVLIYKEKQGYYAQQDY